jgi:hypothetical protein
MFPYCVFATVTAATPDSLYSFYHSDDLISTINNAKRLLAVFEEEWDHHVVTKLTTNHALSTASIDSSSSVAGDGNGRGTFVVPASVDTTVIGAQLEAWSRASTMTPRSNHLYNEASQSKLLLKLFKTDPQLVPLQEDDLSMILRWDVRRCRFWSRCCLCAGFVWVGGVATD